MATLQTRCLLGIFLVNLPRCLPLRDAPALPDPPFCHRPCDMTSCSPDIHCQWSPSPGDQTHTNYSLHWKGPTGKEQSSAKNIIGREHFECQEELRVWVEAKNPHASAKSPELVLNPAGIRQPPPPIIQEDPDEAFQICWKSACENLGLFIGTCSVQYRTEVDADWHEEDGFYSIYMVEEPQPCTTYDFRARCSCRSGFTSDWSAILTIQREEKTPEGELDVWRDCEPPHAHSGCVLLWKRLPVSQACGFILGYEITLNSARFNVSSAEPENKLNCSEVWCRFAVERSASVSVSAYNAQGATKPSVLKWLESGKEENTPALLIIVNAENLTVSWNHSYKIPDNLKAYVVQYKQYGSGPGQSFDWARLNRSQTAALFRGQFKNYTAYQVSLFALSIGGEVHHISSAFGYSLQKVPSRVTSFEVISLGNRQVILQWEPVPIRQQYGLILCYEIGVGEQKVHNVSARTRSLKLDDLSPGEVYDVWIRPVNEAGPGEKATRKFTTKEAEDFNSMPVIIITSVILVICILGVLGFFAAKCGLCESKVPDPNNSQIFREMKPQPSDSMAWICILLSEPHPTMSSLEIVTTKSPQDVTSDTEKRLRDRKMLLGSQDTVKEDSVTEECGQEKHRCEPEAYRKIVDSDEEDMKSSDEEPGMTGYERHFMPTATDMLEVSS